MPVLNYHKDDPTLPDMNQPQMCDNCECVQIGNEMYFAYIKDQIGILCHPCYCRLPGTPDDERPKKRGYIPLKHKLAG